MPVSGAAVAAGTAGVILLWSAVTGKGILGSVQDIVRGKKPGNIQSSGGSPGSAAGSPPGTPPSGGNEANKALGRLLAAPYGWSTGNEWNALDSIVMAESGWNNTAQNPTSTAYGIGQFLDTTWATVGYSKTSDPATQITAMLKYIKERYGDPVSAWQFHLANGWY